MSGSVFSSGGAERCLGSALWRDTMLERREGGDGRLVAGGTVEGERDGLEAAT